MKAKEYAQQIAAAPERTAAVAQALEDIVLEALTQAGTRHTVGAILACFREGFLKWKSVVAQIDLAGAEVLFPKMLGVRSPELLALALAHKVFLGYEPDGNDTLRAETGRLRLEREALFDRLDQMRRDAARDNVVRGR